MFTEDLSVFFDLGGFAIQATWGALPANVIFSEPTEDLLGGDASGTDYTVDLPATSWPGIKRGDVVTIDGRGAFALREPPRLLSDGAIKRLSLYAA